MWVWVAPIVILVAAIAVGGARVLPSLIAAPAQPTALIQPTVSVAIQMPSLPATQPPQVAPGIVRITSSVEGAAILVDGQPAGRTPQSLSLQPGGYQLTLQAATYRDWEQHVEVAEGQQVPVQAILDPLQPLEVLDVVERALGRDAAVDTGRIVRVRAPVDTFQVSDVVNAVVYFRPKTYQIRDISYNVTHRWQIAGATEPGVVAATSRGSRDEPLLFTHACALAAQLDPRGSGVPLSLEVLIESEVVARFGFRVAGGSLSNAPPDAGQACDRSRLPNVIVAAPRVETTGGHAL
jgi:hypothetical protein